MPCCLPAEVIKSCRFLGRAEVALADTLSMLSGVPAGTPLWLPLMRRDAGDSVRWAVPPPPPPPLPPSAGTRALQAILARLPVLPGRRGGRRVQSAARQAGPTHAHVSHLPPSPPPRRLPRSGQLQLRFVWEVTARSLLTIKLHALERVLAQRQEILAALQPVPPAVVRGWAPPDGGEDGPGDAAERSAAAAAGGVMAAGVNLFGVDNELGLSGEEAARGRKGMSGPRVLAAMALPPASPRRRFLLGPPGRRAGPAQPRSLLIQAAPAGSGSRPLPALPLPSLLPLLPPQARAGPSSPPRSPPRCWRATPTTTTAATWWPRCWKPRGWSRAGAWWWRSGAWWWRCWGWGWWGWWGWRPRFWWWAPRHRTPGMHAQLVACSTPPAASLAPLPASPRLPPPARLQRQRAAQPRGHAGPQGLPNIHHTRGGALAAAQVRAAPARFATPGTPASASSTPAPASTSPACRVPRRRAP